MEAVEFFIGLLIALPVIFFMLMIVALVLQWAYRLVVRRELRYSKALKIMLALFLINAALNFISGGITVSMNYEEQQLADLVLLPVTFMIGVGIYAYWLNDKRGRPIGWLKAFAVQGIFYAIAFVAVLLFVLPVALIAGP